MKSTEAFKQTIQAYLERRAQDDPLFAPSYAKPGKNIDDCITYILNTVQASGCNGFADEEVFSMAVHYYDEDNIEVGAATTCNVVVNHVVELTAEEQEQARKDAIKRLQDETIEAMKKKPAKAKKEEPAAVQQASLF